MNGYFKEKCLYIQEMSGKRESIFDILMMNYLFTSLAQTSRYYKCTINTSTKVMECVQTNIEDGSVCVPSSVPVGKESEFLSNSAKIPVKII